MSSITSRVWGRECGIKEHVPLRSYVMRKRYLSLTADTAIEIDSHYSQPVTAMDIDVVEQRYLLSGSNDGTLAIFDLESAQSVQEHVVAQAERAQALEDAEIGLLDESESAVASPNPVIGPLFENQWRAKHAYSVSDLGWYPFDTGMFVTGSHDHHVGVWDTNELDMVFRFDLEGAVNSVHMSPIATSHSLIAATSASRHIQLCDIKSGSKSHVLVGHDSTALCARWSPTEEFVLASCSDDRTVRLWDIRRPGCLSVFDQHNIVDPQMNKKYVNPADRVKSKLVESHSSAVTCIQFSSDGVNLMSSGLDGRLRCWDVLGGRNTLVNFSTVRNRSRRAKFSLAPSGDLVFYPVGRRVYMLDTSTGKQLKVLSGAHFDDVLCVVCHPTEQLIFSAGCDTSIMAWGMPLPEHDSTESEAQLTTEDWVDDDDSML